MPLTPDQLPALKAAIQADPALAALPDEVGYHYQIADAFNLPATPDYWVLKTAVPEQDYTDQVSPDGTSWSWPAFIARSLQEQNGWARMFARGSVNPSRAGVRQGFADIFSGSSNNAPAQRTHLTAMSRRPARRGERLYVVATPGGAGARGSAGNPDTLTFEGLIPYTDVQAARALP